MESEKVAPGPDPPEDPLEDPPARPGDELFALWLRVARASRARIAGQLNGLREAARREPGPGESPQGAEILRGITRDTIVLLEGLEEDHRLTALRVLGDPDDPPSRELMKRATQKVYRLG